MAPLTIGPPNNNIETTVIPLQFVLSDTTPANIPPVTAQKQL